MDDDQEIQWDLPRLVDKVDGLDARLYKLQGQVAELCGARRSSDDAGSPKVVRLNVWPAIETEELENLAKWVDGLQERYAAAGDWLRPCWWRHGFVVEELAALRTAWLDLSQPDDQATSMAALQWHEAAEKCRERVRRAIGTGPGCTAVNHKPDQLVTDDPRWVDERAALSGEMSDLPGPPTAGADEEDFGSDDCSDHRERPSDDGSPSVST